MATHVYLPRKINPKQERFCIEYSKDHNATGAAIRAGYAQGGAAAKGCELLKTPAVREEIDRIARKVEAKSLVKINDVVEGLAEIAFGSIEDVVRWTSSGVELIPANEMTERAKRTIDELTTKTTNKTDRNGNEIVDFNFKVKQHSRIKALELLGKYLGMFTERVEVTVDNRTDDQIADKLLNDIPNREPYRIV